MKKTLLGLLFLVLGSGMALGQEVIYPRFTDQSFQKLTQFQEDMLAIQDIEYMEVRMISPKWEKSKIVWHEVQGGKLVRSKEQPMWAMVAGRSAKGDTVDMNLYAAPVGEDSVKMNIRMDKSNIRLTQGFHFDEVTQFGPVWMETYLDDSGRENEKQIPVVAFTRGIKGTRIFQGEEVTGIDYCGLRDAKVHPKHWAERFGITDYIYLTIEFEDQ